MLSDLAYAEVYFDNNPPPSILQVPGANDVAVEFTSMSKTYSMPGWRIGFAVGNERIIAALTRVKSYLDYGAFTPVQVAATAALNGPDDCIREMRDTYRKRRDAMVESFGRAGWQVPSPAASMFAWAPIPEPFKPLGSVEFSKLLVEKAEVAVAPGIGFGEHGDDHVRIALVENEQRIRQAARNIRRFLESGAKHCTTSFLSPRAASALAFFGFRMVAPLRVGLAGLGTVGAAVIRLIEPSSDRLPRVAGGRSKSSRVCARSKGKDRGVDLKKMRWLDDPLALARDPGIDVFVELMGGEGDPAKSAIEAALAAKKSVVTANKALLARHGVALAELAEENGVAVNFEAAVARRHSGGQDVARGSCRKFVRARLRHSQRHLQLHPDADGAGKAVLRRLPEGCAAARLRRGRPDLRYRRPRHRAEAVDPGEPRLRNQGRSRRGLCRGHFLDRARRSRGRRRARLSREASWRRGEDRRASSSACIRPWCRRIPRSRR